MLLSLAVGTILVIQKGDQQSGNVLNLLCLKLNIVSYKIKFHNQSQVKFCSTPILSPHPLAGLSAHPLFLEKKGTAYLRTLKPSIDLGPPGNRSPPGPGILPADDLQLRSC